MTTVDVELQVACATESLPREDEIRAWIEAAIEAADRPAAARLEVVVRVVDERESRSLNYRFRQKDRPTNVLAFPATVPGEAPGPVEEDPVPLGDLAICALVLEREAAEQGKAPAAHWAHLLVHGTLHLLGYDHQAADEAARMEGLETRILAARGLPDPYADRMADRMPG